MMNKFKAGDKVYYPFQSNKVLTVYEHDDSNHPIMVDLGSRHTYTFTIDGKFYIGNARPSIFHATPENHKALEQLYGVELEEPSVKEVNFKVGDLVYCPLIGTQVFQLEANSSILGYSLGITYYYDGTEKLAAFTPEGLEYKYYKTPQIFPATPEMKAKLEQLYGIKLEASPVKPTSREIIQAKLNKSTEPVPCWVTNNSDRTQPNRTDVWAFIQEVDTDPSSKFPFLAATGNWWMHATPFDPHTGEAITELPE